MSKIPFAKVHLHPFPHASVDPQKPVAIMHPVLWFRAMVLSQVFKKTGRKAYRLQSAWIQRNPRREKRQFGNVDPIRPNWPWADKTCILLPRFSAQITTVNFYASWQGISAVKSMQHFFIRLDLFWDVSADSCGLTRGLDKHCNSRVFPIPCLPY